MLLTLTSHTVLFLPSENVGHWLVGTDVLSIIVLVLQDSWVPGSAPSSWPLCIIVESIGFHVSSIYMTCYIFNSCPAYCTDFVKIP